MMEISDVKETTKIVRRENKIRYKEDIASFLAQLKAKTIYLSVIEPYDKNSGAGNYYFSKKTFNEEYCCIFFNGHFSTFLFYVNCKTKEILINQPPTFETSIKKTNKMLEKILVKEIKNHIKELEKRKIQANKALVILK